MSCVGIFIGQCGVSIGLEILNDAPPFLQCYDGSQHAIFIDTEIKVLRRIQSRFISSTNVFSDLPGCGGCFAKGISSAESFVSQIMDKIQGEIERTDCCMGFLLVHSLCGGTGSGYGSCITQEIKCRYPEMFVANVAVLPFRTGENPIQSYNVVLAVERLQQASDMMILVENSVVVTDLATKSNVSMDQINSKIVQDLQIIFRNSKQTPNRCAMWELIKIVSAIPTIKFTSFGSYFGLDNTDNCNQAARSIKRRTGFSKSRSIAGVVLNSDTKYCLLSKPMETKFQKAFNFVDWNPFPVEFWCSKSKDRGINYAINNEHIVTALLEEADRALLKCDAGAYLHWFEQYGIGKSDFQQAFEVINKIHEDYTYYCK